LGGALIAKYFLHSVLVMIYKTLQKNNFDISLNYSDWPLIKGELLLDFLYDAKKIKNIFIISLYTQATQKFAEHSDINKIF
jgi:hypothetical protein